MDVTVESGSLALTGSAASVVLLGTPPLFVVGAAGGSAFDSLRAELRLSGLSPTEDATVLFSRAVLDARLSFYRKLGEDRVMELTAIPFKNNPINESQILRAIASSVEILLIRRSLLRTLRVAFMDGGSLGSQWNNDAFTREGGGEDIDAELARLSQEIEEAMELLSGSEVLGSESTGGDVQTFEPSTTPDLPRSSVWPYLRT